MRHRTALSQTVLHLAAALITALALHLLSVPASFSHLPLRRV